MIDVPDQVQNTTELSDPVVPRAQFGQLASDICTIATRRVAHLLRGGVSLEWRPPLEARGRSPIVYSPLSKSLIHGIFAAGAGAGTHARFTGRSDL